IDFAVPERDTTISDVATALDPGVSRHRRVEGPYLPSAGRVERKDLAPGARDIHDTVNDKRCRFLDAMGRTQVVVPRQLQLPDTLRVDLLQRAEPLLVVGAAVSQPVGAVRIRSSE